MNTGGLQRNRTADTRIFNPSENHRASRKLKILNGFLAVEFAAKLLPTHAAPLTEPTLRASKASLRESVARPATRLFLTLVIATV
jgi:hypothetical protein